MATKIVTKNSSTASAVPTASDLVQGELAVNVADKRLFTEDNGGNIVELGTNPTTLIVDTTTLVVDSTNNRVGIGTTSPQAPLHVHGDINLGNSAGADAADVEIASLNFYNRDTSGSAPNNASIIRAYSHSNTGSGGYLTFATSFGGESEGADATEKMRIDSTGNVGIGTSSPTAPLSVLNAASTATTVQIGSSTLTHNTGIYLRTTGVAGLSWGQGGDFAFYGGGAGSTERMRIDSSGNVGIGTSSPEYNLDVTAANNVTTTTALSVQNSSRNYGLGLGAYTLTNRNIGGSVTTVDYTFDIGGDAIFKTSNSERMRIESSGNVGIGTTSPSSLLTVSSPSEGTLIELQTSGAHRGGIGVRDGDLYIGEDAVGLSFDVTGADGIRPFSVSGQAYRDNAIDLGSATARFDDIYATNGTINTSDRNEKQDIAELSDAEQRVAVAAKGLLRKFRWKDSVAEKGDDARIHFGIIAQDLQAAFEAEGLDAGRYGMFISTTWWEQDVEVPAVEASEAVYETQTDDEGNETQVLIDEAVDAVDSYTKTNNYPTIEEAPEGATEKTRLGVRYTELLAFIIAAL